MNKPLRSVVIIFILFFCAQARAQSVSPKLYASLPAKLQPKDATHPTIKEQCAMLSHADEYASINDSAVTTELDGLAEAVDRRLATLDNQEQMKALIQLARYHMVFRNRG